MLDHMTFRVRDIAVTKAFYAAALAPLGYTVAYEGSHDGSRMLGFGAPGLEPGQRAHHQVAEHPGGLDVHADVVGIELAAALRP